MSSRPELRLDWASNEAARYACKHWHYSKCVPVFKTIRIGVWEQHKFVGVVLFGSGANNNIGSPYMLTQNEICELTRVALSSHVTPVSRIIALSMRFLKKRCPKLKMVVSYADASQGHHGGIYQAGGWVYTGSSKSDRICVNGVWLHPKTLHSRYGTGGDSIPWLQKHVDKNAKRGLAGLKHKYLMPLDDEMRKKIEPLRKPYPKRVRSADSGTPEIQSGGGGANPTRTLSDTPGG